MEELLVVLKQLAEEFKPRMISNVRKAITDWTLPPVYLSLFDYVFEVFYLKADSGGRWYDPYHVAYSTLFAAHLVKAREASPWVVPAVILHDIGYHSSLVDKENWASPNSRIIHMQEGAGMAAQILIKIGGFNANAIGAIVGMVASHDNGYLSITTNNSDRLALRDADRIWVMHPLSFYKDWISKKIKGEELSPLDLLQSRAVSFFGKEENACPLVWGRINNPDREDKIQSPPATELAKTWRHQQFWDRFYEIKDNITGSPKIFRSEIADNIKSELAAGRG